MTKPMRIPFAAQKTPCPIHRSIIAMSGPTPKPNRLAGSRQPTPPCPIHRSIIAMSGSTPKLTPPNGAR